MQIVKSDLMRLKKLIEIHLTKITKYNTAINNSAKGTTAAASAI
jgi:hypothetical protein